MNSVLIEMRKDKLRVVATNGHVLFLAKVESSGEVPTTIVSRVDVARFLALKPSEKCEDFCRVARCARKVSFAADGSLLTFKPVDAQYPPYEAVLPKYPVKSAVPTFGLSPTYMRDVCETFRIMGLSSMKVQAGKEWNDPILFTPESKGSVDFKIVLMPMRIA
jgi:DNA polymerase III sliding clamp (beta) subunit (PCNA family)